MLAGFKLIFIIFCFCVIQTITSQNTRVQSIDVVLKTIIDSVEKNKQNFSYIFLDSLQQIILTETGKVKSDTIKVANQKLFVELKRWLGTKYKYSGTTDEGIDCSSLMQNIFFNVFEKALPRSCKEQKKGAKKIIFKKLEPTDFVFFTIKRKRKKALQHIGMLLNKDFFIHASTSFGVIISRINDPYYKKYRTGFGRIVLN